MHHGLKLHVPERLWTPSTNAESLQTHCKEHKSVLLFFGPDFIPVPDATNIDANNTKFYIIQALKGGGKFYTWSRWGIEGEPGQSKLQPCPDENAAIKVFFKKFREKTGNPYAWADRALVKPKDGKYFIVEGWLSTEGQALRVARQQMPDCAKSST